MTIEVTLRADGYIEGPLTPERPVHLTRKELAMLLAVANRKGGIVTKQGALTEVYGGRDEPELKIVDVFVCKIRAKLAKVGATDTIETVWGQGYRWSKEVKLRTPDSSFVSMETSPGIVTRLEDLALAMDTNVSGVLARLVEENIDQLEEDTWK